MTFPLDGSDRRIGIALPESVKVESGEWAVISKRGVPTAILGTATNKHLISEKFVGGFWLVLSSGPAG